MRLPSRSLIHSAPLLALLLLPAGAFADASPSVVAVYPSGRVLPERVLRLSIIFAAAPGAPGVDAIKLRLSNGAEVEGALLSDRLWSSDRRTLTLLFDPGRVKSGLIAHDVYGGPLSAGQNVALVVGGRRAHEWRVESGGCVPPNPAGRIWRLRCRRHFPERRRQQRPWNRARPGAGFPSTQPITISPCSGNFDRSAKVIAASMSEMTAWL